MAEPKRHWNHRVIQYETTDGPWLQIHEVHYEDGVLTGWSGKAEPVVGETVEGLRWTLSRMEECLAKPILLAVDLPGYDPNERPS